MKKLKCFLMSVLHLFKSGHFVRHNYEGEYEAEDVIIIYDGKTIRETDSYIHGLNEVTMNALKISMKCRYCGHEAYGYISKDGGRVE